MKNKFLPTLLTGLLLLSFTLSAQHEYYGMSKEDGTPGAGTIFKTDSTGANFRILHSFNGTTEGAHPLNSLSLAPDGKFYGFASGGGTFGAGTLFQYDPIIDSYTVVLNLIDSATGDNPTSSPLIGSDGNIYGASYGNESRFFRYKPATGAVQNYNLFWWTEWPEGDLIEVNGNIYGTTENGGGNGASGYQGRLYRFNISTQTFTYIHDFLATQGYLPVGPPALWSNGLLYGTTHAGGVNGKGVIYSYNTLTNAYTELVSLSDSFQPVDGRLVLATDNKFYGISYAGGPNDMGYNWGTLFSYDPATNLLKRAYNFIDNPQYITGNNGVGELMEASNGKIYGTTSSDIFEFNFATNDSAAMRSYEPVNLNNNAFTHLTELCTKPRYLYYTDTVFNFCTGTTWNMQLHCPNAVSIQWLHNGIADVTRTTDTLSFTNIALSDSGTWQCLLTNQCGVTKPAVITLHVKTAGNGTVTSALTPAGDTLICPGSNITRHGNNGGVWNTGATGATLTVGQPGSFQVTNTNSCGITLSNIIKVDTVVAPSAPRPAYYTNSLTLCQPGDSALLFGNTGGVWSTGSTADSIYITQPGTYFITKSNGCTTDTSAAWENPTFTYAVPPAIYALGPVNLCNGDSVILGSSSAFSVWSNGYTGTQQFVSTTGNYFCYVATPDCGNLYSNTIHIQADSLPLDTAYIIPSGPVTFCIGDSVILQSNFNYSIWSTGDTANSIVVKNGGQYQVTDAGGCNTVTSAVLTVNVDALAATTPAEYFSGFSALLCAGSVDTLTVVPPAQYYAWSNGMTTADIIVSQAGTYGLTVSDSVGCSVTALPVSIQVTSVVPPVPYITVTGSDTACQGSSVQLTANGAHAYVWQDGTPGPVDNVFTSGQYTVTAYTNGGGGCTSVSAPVTVTILPAPAPPVIQLNGSNNSCQGSLTLSFDTTGWQFYDWTTGDTTATIIPAVSGSIRIVAENTQGCYAISAPVIVSIKPSSFDTISQIICSNENYLFNGRAVQAAGTYYDTLTNAIGCDSIVTLHLSVDSINTPTIVRSGNNLQTQLFTTYQWLLNNQPLNGAIAQTLNVTQNGNYSVVVTGLNGCRDTSAVLQVRTLGLVDIAAGYDVKLYPNPNNGNFTIEFTDEMIHDVEITDALGRIIMPPVKVEKQKDLDLPFLAPGIYFLHMNQNPGGKSLKFSVIK